LRPVTRGYLRLIAFWGNTERDNLAAGLTALDAAVDEIFSAPPLEGLVIDVRINFGGTSRYEMAVSSRLAAREYLAYTIQARSDPTALEKAIQILGKQ
jgi:C-terminal processing protease CtpA/Prc